MLENFQRSASDFVYSGDKPPYEAFVLPPFLKEFGRDVLERKFDNDQPVRQMCLFGGVFLDQKLGLKPKDYDIYICCPELVKDLSDFYENASSHSCSEDALQTVIGYDFPLSLHEDSLHRERLLDLFGVSFGLVGSYHHKGNEYRMDITIGTEDVQLSDIAKRASAPVISAAANIHPDQETSFAYHMDFERQASERIFAPHSKPNQKLLLKAERKGLTIISP